MRASALPAFADCHRRAVAVALAKDGRHGWHFNSITDVPHISSIMGTLLHETAQSRLAEAGYLAKLRDVQGPVRYDDVTPDETTAARQCVRMAEMLEQSLGAWGTTDLVESALGAAVEGVDLTGHPDRVVFETGSDKVCDVHDLKTSMRAPGHKHITQLGAYGLLLQAKGYRPEHGFIHHLPRTRLSRPQERVTTQVFAMDMCMEQALVVIREIRDAEDLKPEQLAANTMSSLCSPQWCPAHGRAFCPSTCPITETREETP